MGLSQPRVLYSIHEVSLYNILTGVPYGKPVQVVKNSTLALAGELVQLQGGSNPYPWSVQDGNSSAEMNFSPAEIPDYFFELFLGKAPTTVENDAGNTTALTNKLNETVQDASTGIASVGVKSGSESDLKFGKYIVVAVSATTVDVYALTGVDFLRGTDKDFIDDSMKITSSPLTITASAAVEVPGFGVELTGGSGVIGMTAGDTAVFDINPPSLVQTNVIIGSNGQCSPEFGAYVTAQKQSDGSMWAFDCYRVKAQGFPFNMAEKAFSEPEITGQLIYCPAKNGILEVRYIKPSTGCS